MKLYETEISSANILRAAAGTTGFRGGDSGHGCRTIIEIQDLGATDLVVEKLSEGVGVRLSLGGDSELETIIQALDFVVDTLRAHSNDKGTD